MIITIEKLQIKGQFQYISLKVVYKIIRVSLYILAYIIGDNKIVINLNNCRFENIEFKRKSKFDNMIIESRKL